MPIYGIYSYNSVTQSFALNWDNANDELGANPITLIGDYSQSLFVADRAAVVSAIDAVPGKSMAARMAANFIAAAKIALVARAVQLRGAIISKVGDPKYLKMLVPAPAISTDLPNFTQILCKLAELWEMIDADATNLGLANPITLQNGYTLAQFQSDIAALTPLSTNALTANSQLSLARGARDALLGPIYERMKQYRIGAKAALPVNSPALKGLPLLTPARGSTPPAVVVTAVWEEGILKARLSWNKSLAKHGVRLQLRGCTGGSYKNGDEEVIFDLPFDATEALTDWGLEVEGAIATFKIFVITEGGHENGGKAVKVVRPFVGV